MTPPPVTPAPSITITSNPASVLPGGSVVLTWNASNAASCSASGGWSGAQATSGTFGSGAINATTTYTLTCTGTGGSTTRSVTVNVNQAPPPLPTVTLSVNPGTIASGGSATLTWSSTNAATVTASGGWSGSLAASGSKSTGTLNATTTFTINASNATGNATPQSVTVTVTTAQVATFNLVAGQYAGPEIGYLGMTTPVTGSLSPTTLFATGLTVKNCYTYISAGQELVVWLSYNAGTTQTNRFDSVSIVDDVGTTRTFYSNNLGSGQFATDGATFQEWEWKMGTGSPAMNTVGKTYHVTFSKA